MSQRDEQKWGLVDALWWKKLPWGGRDKHVSLDANAAHAAADLILAAGYRKPRTITTIEELDALPIGSVVLSAQGAVFECFNTPGYWQEPGLTWIPRSVDISLPATVLYEPEAHRAD